MLKLGTTHVFASDQYTIEMRSHVIDSIIHDVRAQSELEAGGILLGYVERGLIQVVEATSPAEEDQRSRLGFIRSAKAAQSRIDSAWEESGGTRIYLGEWHSHPEGRAIPSSADRKMIARAHVSTEMEIDFLMILIVGMELDVWTGVQTSSSFCQARMLSPDLGSGL